MITLRKLFFMIAALLFVCIAGYCETNSLVDFADQATVHEISDACELIVEPLELTEEEIASAFSMSDDELKNLSVYYDGFIYESEYGTAISDVLYMIDHENLDQLRSFNLSFMSLDAACESVVKQFDTLGIRTSVEAAYAINADEYERLFDLHREWIEDNNRSKATWPDEDICYVIYLYQTHEDICIYPAFYMYDELANNLPGSEIVVFLFKDGIEYISCGWPSEIKEKSASQEIISYNNAKDAFSKAYDYILTLNPERITVDDMRLMYVSFEQDGMCRLKPFWRIAARIAGEIRRDYLVDAISGEVLGL